MRAIAFFPLVLLLAFSACQEPAGKKSSSSDQEANQKPTYYQEKQLAFTELRDGYKPGMDWIKDPKVLFMVHESLHKVGYLYLNEHFSLYDFVDIQKPQIEWVDSLVLTYDNYAEAPKYYREFWQRRVVEGNQDVVHRIMEEVKQTLIDGAEFEFFPEMVNDTLADLIAMRMPLEDRPAADPNQDLEKLIDYGLHQSAYNLISGEHYQYEDVKWTQPLDSIVPRLRKVDEYEGAWLVDNTK